jgi:2-polyprenyl-3-methyl-5-hydroxy-6-metoxy-1,4-benzoquinol methylase
MSIREFFQNALGNPGVGATVPMLLRRIKRIVLPDWENYSAEEWNRQHSSSMWKYLAGLEQVPRYAMIEGWRHRLKPSGRVLDLGCGEGVLLQQISPSAKVNYLGVDLSQVAIDAAKSKIRDSSIERFVCADLTTFDASVGSAFDVIVFNEVLCYVSDPVATINRYRTVLARDGLVIVSVFHENWKTWKVVDKSLASKRLQTTLIQDSASGKAWHLGLFEYK